MTRQLKRSAGIAHRGERQDRHARRQAARKWERIVLFGLMAALGAGIAVAKEPEQAIFVAMNGRDDNPGTQAKPFATLQRARDEARRRKEKGPVTIYVRGGVYALAEPLRLGPEDAGTAERPIVYRAYGEEKPVLIGSLPIKGFRPWRGAIWQSDLRGSPLENVRFRQLFCDGQRMEMARYPNADYSDPHRGQWAYVLASDPEPAARRSTADVMARARDHFTATPDVIKPTWDNIQDAEICIHPAYGWAWNILPLRAVDPDKHIFYLAKPTSYGIMVGDRYFVRNLLAEVDAPREWYLDRRNKILYFWPPKKLTAASAVRAPVLDSLIVLEKTAHITIRGFRLEECEGAAVQIKDSVDCVIGQSVIRNCGGWGVVIQGGKRCGAQGNDISETGAGGVSINAGDRTRLERGDCYADNNYIHHIAEFQRTYNTGVNLWGVGNRATHNLIHDCYHQGLLVGGNDQLVAYNIVHHTNLGSEDTGGLYMSSRDFTQRGTVIRYNIFHHCGGFGKANSWAPVSQGRVKFVYPGFTWGIYLDAPECGVTVYGNILYEVPVCGLFNHEGRDNVWENNIIVDAPAFKLSSGNYPDLDALSYSYVKRLREQGDYERFRLHYPELDTYTDDPASHHTCAPGHFRHNIIYYTHNPGRYNAARRKSWQGQLVYIVRAPQPAFEGFRFEENCIFAPPDLPLKFSLTLPPEKGGMLSWEEWRQTGQDERSLLADPLFVDPAARDFRLRPNSPALRLGFRPIPVEKIGPYRSEWRATWPIREAPGAARLGDFTTERYFVLPGQEAKAREPLTYRVPRREKAIQIDGVLEEWPVQSLSTALVCRENFTGEPTAGLPSYAWAAYDDEALYIAVHNLLREPQKIVRTGVWGSRDGIEIAFQEAEGKRAGPILSLYGYPDGTFESVTVAGASPAQAERLRAGVTYAARVTDQGWDAEWRLLWRAAGIEPRRLQRLRFNLGVRKMEDNAWVVWRGTGGCNYDVAHAGWLVFER